MSLLAMQVAMRSWLQSGSAARPPQFAASAAPGLRVYRNNYRSQLISCLEESFPHTRAWLGDDSFFIACADHVTTTAPDSWTIDDYAGEFPTRLAVGWPDDPEVFELAWLELTLGKVFVAADAPQVTLEELGAVDWDRAQLLLAPSLRSARAGSNAGAIWSALAAGDPPPAAARLPEEGAYLVWRSGFTAQFRMVEADEYEAIRLIGSEPSFAGLCSHAIARRGENAGIECAAGWLGRWIADGLISRIV